MFKAGFATKDITPETGVDIPGSYCPKKSDRVIDPLMIHAGVITNSGKTLVLIGIDAISLPEKVINTIRHRIGDVCGIPAEAIWIAASHTHCGGPTNNVFGTEMNSAYIQTISNSILNAVIEAVNKMQKAELVSGTETCSGWSFNRRFKTRQGREVSNPEKGNPDILAFAGPTDPELGVLWFYAHKDKKPIGCIVNFACHCTVMFGNTGFSGDYPAYWRTALKKKTGINFPVIFLNGACGDIGPCDFTNVEVMESGKEWAEKMGLALAEATMKAVENGTTDKSGCLEFIHGKVYVEYRRPEQKQLDNARKLLKKNERNSSYWLARDVVLLNDEVIKDKTGFACPVDVARIGYGVIAAAPWQPFCEYGLRIKNAVNACPIMVSTFTNGSIGYVPTPQAFEAGGYEPTLCRGSNLHPKTGDRIVKETIRLAEKVLAAKEILPEKSR